MKTIELDDWEINRLSQQTNSTLLTYIGHYCDAGLFRHEVEIMNKLGQLSHKLGSGTWEDRPYRGTRRNGFNPEADQ